MKTVKIDLPDEEAEALERVAAEGGFASSSALVRATIEDLIAGPIGYDPEALARDVAQHEAAKRRGDAGLGPGEARAWLKSVRSH